LHRGWRGDFRDPRSPARRLACRPKPKKALSNSVGPRTSIGCNPIPNGMAVASITSSTFPFDALSRIKRAPTRAVEGTTCLSNSSRFAINSGKKKVDPVTFPPGSARLAEAVVRLRYPIRRSRCCARAASGPVAEPPRSVMNSRRLIANPAPGDLNPKVSDLSVWVQPVECPKWVAGSIVISGHRPAWQQGPLSAQKRKYFHMSYYVFGSRAEMLDPLLSAPYAMWEIKRLWREPPLQDAQPSTW
jgi:hypothetical protein